MDRAKRKIRNSKSVDQNKNYAQSYSVRTSPKIGHAQVSGGVRVGMPHSSQMFNGRKSQCPKS